MVMGRVQQISEKQTGINYFAESGMTLVAKDMKQVRAFTLQDRGWEGA